MIYRTAWILLACVVGCSSATPRSEYPRYYDQWSHLNNDKKVGLDSVRLRAAANPEDIESILIYARVASQLAREEASRWFEAHDRPVRSEGTQRIRVASARSRLLESCHHGSALYREAQLKGGTLSVDDRLNLLWLHLFSGRELEAEAILDSLSREEELPVDVRDALEQVRDGISEELDRGADE